MACYSNNCIISSLLLFFIYSILIAFFAKAKPNQHKTICFECLGRDYTKRKKNLLHIKIIYNIATK